MRHPIRVEGHRGVGDGAPHDDLGARMSDGTGGPGRAKCECGELSGALSSRVKRIGWQRRHREDLAGMPWTR